MRMHWRAVMGGENITWLEVVVFSHTAGASSSMLDHRGRVYSLWSSW